MGRRKRDCSTHYDVEDIFEPTWGEEDQVQEDVEVEAAGAAQANLPSNAPAISRFLALRLVYGTHSQAEIQAYTLVIPTKVD
eukprot:4179634-Amphidinium_carterae.2